MSAIVAAVLLTVGAVGFTAWLLPADTAADVLTPEPARVVQSFVSALAAGRAVSAEQYLAPSAREPETLARLYAAAAGARIRIQDADTLRHGDAADVRAQISIGREPAMERRFRLVRDAGSRLWKITQFELS
jgi:hypothetical protein